MMDIKKINKNKQLVAKKSLILYILTQLLYLNQMIDIKKINKKQQPMDNQH